MSRRSGIQSQISNKLSRVTSDLNGMGVGHGKESSEVFTTDSLPTTLAEDLGLLLKKLRVYRSSLNEKEKEEFQCEFSFHFFVLFLI